MKKLNFLPAAALAAALGLGASHLAGAAAFTPGNLAVLRLGDGSIAPTSISTNIFIDEYTTAGAFVQSISVPTSGASALVNSGSATSEGALTRSANGRWLCFAGYNTNIGVVGVASSTSLAAPRGVGVVDASGAYSLAVTTSNQFSGNNIRAGTSDGTNSFWGAGGTSGTYYFGLSSGTNTVQATVLNTRVLNVINGNLYFGTGSGTVGVYGFAGGGLPVVPTAASLVVNTLGGTSPSPYGFALDPTGNILYVADDRANASGGIQRWTNGPSGFALAYTLGTGAANIGARGLVADWSGPNPVIYATSAESVLNRIFTITDTGSASVATSLATNTANKIFRGLAFAPLAAPAVTVPPQDVSVGAGDTAHFSVTATGSGTLNYQWRHAGTNLPGQTASTLSVNNATSADAGTYDVVIANAVYAVTSSVAVLTVRVVAFLTPHLDSVEGDVTNVLGSTVFINHGLVGVGHISASALDSFGETFGSMSGMQITGFTTNADGSYSGTLNVLPDRGYNLGAFYADYAARINQVGFTFRPYYGSANIGGTTDLEKLNAQTNQFSFGAISGVRFTYFDPNTGSNSRTTGLDPGTNSTTLFGKTIPYVTSFTGVQSPSSTVTNTYTGINKLPLDSEALILKPDGSGYVGDEYGESIYYFNPVKQIIGAILPPAASLPHSPSNTLNFSSAITPANGRRNNQGFEGVSLSPDGTRLFALQQSASVQDSDAANNQRAKNTRLYVYDVSANPTPASPLAEYALTLPIYKLNGNGGAADRTCAQSEIVSLDNTRFLVLSRDGNGLGNAVTNPNVYKTILLVDTSVGAPSNVAGDAARNAEGGRITTASGVLDAAITPLSWVETVNMLNTNQLAKFNVQWDSGTNQVSKLTMGEKWEGMALVSAQDPANPNDYFLFVGNDNDFVTSAGQMRGPDGTIVSYNAFDGYPASRVPAPLDSANSENDTRLLAFRVTITPGAAPAAPLQQVVINVTNRIYSPYTTDLTAGTYVYVDADIAAGSVVRATQRALGYREVDYKSRVPGTLSFTQATPTTNGNTITYNYSTQTAKTAQVGFWVDKDVPIVIGPDGNAYITDGHHTTAGYLSSNAPIRQIVPGLNRVILGHIVANYFNPLNPQAPDDTWWTARAAENNAYLYGTNGDALTLVGEPNYANLQPILPSVQTMPNTPSAVGSGAMLNSAERGLTWGLADGIVVSGTTPAGAKIVGYKKSAPGSSVDLNFVEFYWADFLRHRVVWDNSLSGSPFGSTNGDASVTMAPLSFFTAVANGIALARSEVYHDEYGRLLSAYTNTLLFPPVTVNWANGSLSNGLAAITDTYHLYLRDDSSIAGDISPSAKSTNILHIDTVAGMTVTQTLQNIRAILVNAGGTLATSWKDATVSNSTLRLPAGTGVVKFDTALQGAITVAGGTFGGSPTVNGSLTILSGGTLAPGSSIGTVTVNGPVTLSGATVMEINKSGMTLTSDLVTGITTLIYGGSLTLVATGDALVAGDSFNLFDATTYISAFSTLNLPPLDPGLYWDTSQLIVDGRIRVVSNISLGFGTLPQSQTVNVGATVTLYGGAVGTAPITYQWRFNGNDLSGQTGSSLTLPNIQETNQGQYYFVAQNAAGTLLSSVATVTVNQAPTAQAQSVSLAWNSSVAITLIGGDLDGDTISYTVTVQPTHGTLTGTAPNLTYTPAANYSGPDSLTFRVSDGVLSATAVVSITVQPGFTYRDTDLLLVFRKDNANDVLFNLGNVSNYINQAQGAMNAISFDTNLVLANFGGSFTGVKYALMAVTPLDSVPLRAWFSDADQSGAPRDETFSKWGGQRGKVSQIGISATSYLNSSNQSLVLPPSDPGSYTFIASDGGSLDVSTMGGTVPFPVEQDVPGHLRLIELKVSTANPKPLSTQVGSLDLTLNGGSASLKFTAGVTAPAFTTQPSNQSGECGGSATFSAAASGDGPVSYQWYAGAAPIGGATDSSLTLSPLSLAMSGSYTVVASNAGGSTTSSAATLTVIDTTPPVLNLPANITATRDSAGGKVVNYSASATDACAGSVAVNCTPASGSTFALGVTTVNCSANDGNGNTANGNFTVTVIAGFTYRDTDLLLVFRKDSANDVLFNLGNVSNYINQAQGAMNAISFDTNLVLANFGGSFTGVKYALMAVTPLDSVPLRAWFSDADQSGAPRDETFSKWGGQRGKVSQIGISATSYFNSSNQSLVLPPNDPGSYTFIASDGGSLDVSTMGGTVPFPVEQDVPGHLRLIELKVSTANPKPLSTQVGSLDLTLDGGSASLKFTAGVTAPTFTSQPTSQSGECGDSATFSAATSGDGPVSYQWYAGAAPIGGATDSSLTFSPLSLGNSGSTYSVVASNAGGSTTSSVVMLTVTDTTPPALSLPANITATRDSAGGKVVNYSASATDACAGSVAINCTPASGSTFALGVTTVNCSANDGNGNTANGNFTVTVISGFTYRDTDLLLVFRKDNANDVLFNLGNVSNYINQAQGAMNAISFDTNLVLANFGGSFTGVKYALMAVTPLDSVPLRAWFSDADQSGAPRDETFSKWGGQRGKVSQIGISATSYFNSSNQSLVLPPNDPGSYTFIASDGGSLDVSTMGGTVPFPVEQDVPGHLRLIELKVSTANPKPLSTQVGSLDLTLNGGSASLKFTAGVTAPAFTTQPTSQSAECGSTVTFSAVATGDGPLSYQWYFGVGAIGGATDSTLTLTGVTFANSGSYSVVVSNAGGPTTSSVATLNVVETTGPALAIAKSGANAVLISWPETCASYTLEQTGALTPPSSMWSPVGGSPMLSGGRWEQTVTTSPTNGFFRLRR